MTTMQCPKCPLRFSTRSEVLLHLRQDHRRTTGAGPPDRLYRPAHQPRRRTAPAR